MKKLIYILLTLVFLSCKTEKKDVYLEYNGEIVKVKFGNSKGDSTYTGFGGDNYPSGNIKSMSYFKNGKQTDTLYYYYENGKVKEKGLLKNKFPFGWWSYYDNNGKLTKKSEWIILKDSFYKNQSLYFDKNEDTIMDPSTFFEIEISDTLKLGKNAGRIKNYVTNYNNRTFNLLSVILENKKSEKEIIKDTFGDGTLNPFFGIITYKLGKQKIKIKLEEKILTETKDSSGSYTMEITDHYKYFEKEIYVWDKERETELGKRLKEEMIADYEKRLKEKMTAESENN